MKKWIQKIGQDKAQLFFFIGLVFLLVLSLVLASTLPNSGKDDPSPVNDPGNKEENPTNEIVEEKMCLPFNESMTYKIVRQFYDPADTLANQELSLIRYGKSYRTSTGVSYAATTGEEFVVTTSLSGTVKEVKDSPMYGSYVVIENSDSIETSYYGLKEVKVTAGQKVEQSTILGTACTTTLDQEIGNHVYFQIKKQGIYLNPTKQMGKTLSQIG
jgi:stage II sporulation protein Q